MRVDQQSWKIKHVSVLKHSSNRIIPSFAHTCVDDQMWNSRRQVRHGDEDKSILDERWMDDILKHLCSWPECSENCAKFIHNGPAACIHSSLRLCAIEACRNIGGSGSPASSTPNLCGETGVQVIPKGNEAESAVSDCIKVPHGTLRHLRVLH